MHDASFVEHVHSQTPIQAAKKGRLVAAGNRMVPTDENDEKTLQKQAAELANDVLVIAVFRGHLSDLYDPRLEVDDDEPPGRKER